MTEGNGLEPIETAIFNALTALEDVSVAVATVDQAGPLPGNWRTQFGDLRGHELTADSFCRQEIDRLRASAESLELNIVDETHSWFVHDECNMDGGGHQETATTALGGALIGLQTALFNLADQLSVVVKLQETERFSQLLNR